MDNDAIMCKPPTDQSFTPATAKNNTNYIIK